MSIRELIEKPPRIAELPTWRKVLMAVALGFALCVAAVAVDKHLTIDGSAPERPEPAQGRIYPVDVMHGDIRYVTLEEKQSFLLWAGTAGSWAGAAFMAAFFVWITAPRKSRREVPRPVGERRS